MYSSLERLRARREELRGEDGFTLIELLIVIVILGILAAIVVFAVQNLTGSSAQASCRTDYKSVESAVESYKAQMGAYPTGGGTQANTAAGTTVSTATATDTDAKAGPTNYSGTASSGGVYPGAVISVVNAAATPNPGSPATYPPSNTAFGGELLRGSNTAASNTATLDSNAQNTANLDSPSGTPATSTGAVGPWLKDTPANSGHYTIFVANDGTGTIAVLGPDGKTVLQGKDFPNTSSSGWSNDINACSAVS